MPLVDEPLFDGLAMFGEAVNFKPATPNPVDLQISAYPGVYGLHVTNMGGRGGTTIATGTLVAFDDAALTDLEDVFRAYQQSAAPCILIDDMGNAWPMVVLLNYGRTSNQMVDAAGFVSVDYEVTFLHLV
jgi:hypothetical protein